MSCDVPLTIPTCFLTHLSLLQLISTNTKQTVRNGTPVRARLKQLLTTGSSPNPRWLVRYENQPYKNQEVYEHTFLGKVTTEPEETESKSRGNSPPLSDAGSTESRGRAKRGKKPPPKESSDTEKAGVAAEKPAAETDERPPPEEPADDSPNGGAPRRGAGSPAAQQQSDASSSISAAAARLSAREARIRRRQALAAEQRAEGPPSAAAGGGGGNGGGNRNKRKKPSGGAAGGGRKKQKSNEDCVKIKLLTGTLYLYRGPRRRAEFVRRV